jgi:hypothetical protein
MESSINKKLITTKKQGQHNNNKQVGDYEYVYTEKN